MNFELKELGSKRTWTLYEEAKDRPVMITFWTSWCPDSYRDLHDKRALYQTMDEDQLCFVTINVTGREGDVDLQQWLKQHDHNFLVLQDDGTKVYDQFGCKGVPTTVLLDRRGQVTKTYGEDTAISTIMTGLATVI
ncbi:TlpA disulfide reductase family protein [Shouchella sp. JSM 1781072]|uniref:TlpA disulfide reductase family protein n=1 Tax=Shouchella sp. JSM 1781072 TaxID=3344581 RepID=UPI0035C08CC2